MIGFVALAQIECHACLPQLYATSGVCSADAEELQVIARLLTTGMTPRGIMVVVVDALLELPTPVPSGLLLVALHILEPNDHHLLFTAGDLTPSKKNAP